MKPTISPTASVPPSVALTTKPSIPTRAPHVVIQGRDLFRSEKRKAEAMGFRLQIAAQPGPNTVRVRLVPQTRRAKIICKRHDAVALEATVAIADESERMDGLIESMRSVLAMAKNAGA